MIYYHFVIIGTKKIRRFITEDSYKGELANPLSLNYYAYCAGNPLSYVDPSGHMYGMPDGGDYADRYKNVHNSYNDLEAVRNYDNFLNNTLGAERSGEIAQNMANQYVETGELKYYIGTALFSLWTPDTADKLLANFSMLALGEFVSYVQGVAYSLHGGRTFSALSNSIDDIKTLEYHPRIRERALQDPVFHNFPYSFDKEIMKTNPTILKDGSQFYQFPGSVNGKAGNYELIQNQNGIIYHRNFKPLK